MPTLSVFYGIVIQMYWEDHPPPHFHALYGEYEALVAIDELSVIRGGLRRRALERVREWAGRHQAALMEDWQLCAKRQQPSKLPPLR
ncbi:MAG: DUF4160 domain-containing protein [Pseudomonadota bacterium]